SPHGFLLSGGTFTTLEVPGSGYTQLQGINTTGQIVGSTFSFPTSRGFLFSGGSFTFLSPSGSNSNAFGINDSGTVVGSFGNHGALWRDGSLTTFDRPGAGLTEALGINSSGAIVGDYSASASGGSFLLSDSVFTEIAVPGASETEVFGIN